MGNTLQPKIGPWSFAVPATLLITLALIWGLDANRPLFLYLNGVTSVTGGALWANVTTFGDALVVFSLALFLIERRPLMLWTLIFAALVSTVIVHGLKEMLLVMRPPYYFGPDEINIVGKSHVAVSFPSGHTTAAFMLAGLACLQPDLKRYWKIIALVAALLVGWSRIAVGVHWPLDVLGGGVIACISLFIAAWLAPKVEWGTSLGAQRFFAVLLVGAAVNLLLFHDSGYPSARWLEITIAALAIAGAAGRVRILFRRREEPRLRGEALPISDEERQGASWKSLAIRVGITLFILGMIFRSTDLGAVAEIFRNIVPRLLLLGIVFQMLSTLLASYRWYLVMRPLGFGQGFGYYLKSYFKGFFFNQGLPTSVGGDAIRVLDVARLGFRKREAFYGVFADRVLGLVGLLILNLGANALNPDLLPAGIFTTINFVVAGGLVGFIGLYLYRHFELFRSWQPTRVFSHISDRLSLVLATPRQWACQLGLSVGVHILSMVAIFLVGRSVEMEYDLLTFMVIVPPVILLTLVPISLAGWGVREGAMIGLFTLIGADKTLVLSMSILYGIILIIASLPGLYVYLTGRYRL